VRQRRCEIDLVIDVKIGADWIETGTGDVPWARRLALAPTVLQSGLRAADRV
jgi:hypothetical protein